MIQRVFGTVPRICRRLLNMLTPHVMREGQFCFAVCRWVAARIMLLEAIAVLPEHHVLKGVFRKVQLHPSEQTFQSFQVPSRVYLRFSSLKATAKLTYVGSIAQSVAARKATRFRKFQQLQNER